MYRLHAEFAVAISVYRVLAIVGFQLVSLQPYRASTAKASGQLVSLQPYRASTTKASGQLVSLQPYRTLTTEVLGQLVSLQPYRALTTEVLGHGFSRSYILVFHWKSDRNTCHKLYKKNGWKTDRRFRRRGWWIRAIGWTNHRYRIIRINQNVNVLFLRLSFCVVLVRPLEVKR